MRHLRQYLYFCTSKASKRVPVDRVIECMCQDHLAPQHLCACVSPSHCFENINTAKILTLNTHTCSFAQEREPYMISFYFFSRIEGRVPWAPAPPLAATSSMSSIRARELFALPTKFQRTYLFVESRGICNELQVLRPISVSICTFVRVKHVN